LHKGYRSRQKASKINKTKRVTPRKWLYLLQRNKKTSYLRGNPYIEGMDKTNTRNTGLSLPLVPIRSLGPRHRTRIAEHLLLLDDADRYLRFGYAANDEHINRYAESLDFERDDIYGIYNRKLQLIAMAHLAMTEERAEQPRHAEFGVSVLKQARGRGYGARLFDRAIMHARNDGRDTMFIHALSQNAAMLKIARSAGATVERHGSESDAFLKLPAATLGSRLTEMVEEQMAEVDYGFKQQAKHIQKLLSGSEA
jgi:GNAT superfamily N-acetyltransferase